MKRILSVFLALAMIASMATVAFAEGGKKPTSGHFSGIAEFREDTVDPGDTIELDIDYFYGKWTETEKEWDNSKNREVSVKYTYDNEDYPIGYLEKEYHRVTASWSSGGNYVQGVYFEDGDSFVTIEFKGTATTVDREIAGTIKIIEEGIPNRDRVTYECKIQKGTLTLKGVDQKSDMTWTDDRKFGLPDDYQTKQVRFKTEDGDSYGTFIGEFWSEKSGTQQLAEFKVKIIDQKALFLGLSEAENKTIAKAYPNADLRFINWTARPTFDYAGTLSIFMEPNEYIYGINDDNELYRLGGSWDSANDAYVISTKTLGSYVISDVQLTAGNAGGTTTTTPSSSTAPSSTAPSSTAPPPSSTAPQPSSSVAPPPSSSEESSSEPEESSEPEDIEPEEPDDEEPFEPDDDDDDDGDKENEKTTKKKFPIVPLLFGILGVAVLVCAVVVVGNRNSGSHSRSRRRRYDDDWDD